MTGQIRIDGSGPYDAMTSIRLAGLLAQLEAHDLLHRDLDLILDDAQPATVRALFERRFPSVSLHLPGTPRPLPAGPVHKLRIEADPAFAAAGDYALQVERLSAEGSEPVARQPIFDPSFAFDISNESAARQRLENRGIEAGRFVILAVGQVSHSNEADTGRVLATLAEALAPAFRAHPLRLVIAPTPGVLDADSRSALTQLLHRLPGALRTRALVIDDSWQADEALSLLRRASLLIGCDALLDRLAAHEAVACLRLRCAQRDEAVWSELGLGDWFFDVGLAEERQRLAAVIEDSLRSRAAAQFRMRSAERSITQRQAAAMSALAPLLSTR